MPATVPAADHLPIYDAHLHYNREAWATVTPADAVGLLARSGIARALVSSTPDEGTVTLYRTEPRRFVPILRPYREAGDAARWTQDDTVPAYLERRLALGIHRGIGEVHLSAHEVRRPVVGKVAQLALDRGLPLVVHSDAATVDELFRRWPGLTILWAHAGMSEPPEVVAETLKRHPRLWTELSIRGDIAAGDDTLDPRWRAVFLAHPTRVLVGTDTWTTSRWHELPDIAAAYREWLAQLPREVAENLAWRNAETLFPQR